MRRDLIATSDRLNLDAEDSNSFSVIWSFMVRDAT